VAGPSGVLFGTNLDGSSAALGFDDLVPLVFEQIADAPALGPVVDYDEDRSTLGGTIARLSLGERDGPKVHQTRLGSRLGYIN
jgi:hypothetical protein